MKLIQKLLALLILCLCDSCYEGDYYGTGEYQAYHLINTYVDVNAPQLNATQEGVSISFMTRDANYYYSKEFATVSKKEQSEEQLLRFIELAGKNNDFFTWKEGYYTHGFNINKMNYFRGGSLDAITKGVAKIELVSDADFDKEHPAGVSLMDDVKLISYVYGDIVGKPISIKQINEAYKIKEYSNYTQQEMSVIGSELDLRFNFWPTLSKVHNFTVTITFDDGEVYSDSVKLEF
jgi:hypothetical protein